MEGQYVVCLPNSNICCRCFLHLAWHTWNNLVNNCRIQPLVVCRRYSYVHPMLIYVSLNWYQVCTNTVAVHDVIRWIVPREEAHRIAWCTLSVECDISLTSARLPVCLLCDRKPRKLRHSCNSLSCPCAGCCTHGWFTIHVRRWAFFRILHKTAFLLQHYHTPAGYWDTGTKQKKRFQEWRGIVMIWGVENHPNLNKWSTERVWVHS